MLIREIDPLKNEEYARFADKHGSVFHSPAWLNLYTPRLCVFGIYDKSSALAGIFILSKKRKFGMTFYSDPPFMPDCRLVYLNPSTNVSERLSRDKAIMQCFAEFLDSMKNAVIRVSLPHAYTDTMPFLWRKFKVIPFFTYRISLQNTVDFFDAMSPKLRNNIRSAAKAGLVCVKRDRPVDYFPLFREVFLKKKLAVDLQLTERILQNGQGAYNSMVVAATINDNTAAASFCVYDRKTAWYLLGGSSDTHKHEGAGACTLTEMMRMLKETGVEYFDFEGSVIPEVEKYFRSFGPQLTPYFTVNKAPFLVEIILKFFRRDLF